MVDDATDTPIDETAKSETSLYLRVLVVEAVDRIAAEEDRSRSKVVDRLLEEALRARGMVA